MLLTGTITGGRQAEEIQAGDLIPSGFGRVRLFQSELIKSMRDGLIISSYD